MGKRAIVLCAGALMLPGIAQAADPAEVWLQQVPGLEQGHVQGRIPISGGFQLSYNFGSAGAADARLQVWPASVRPCTAAAPPLSGKQVYALPVLIEAKNQEYIGTAQVPHLQVGIEFCFRLTARAQVKVPEAAVKRVVDATLDDLLEASQLNATTFQKAAQQAFKKMQADSFCQGACEGNVQLPLAKLFKDAPIALIEANDRVETSQESLAGAKKQLESIYQELGGQHLIINQGECSINLPGPFDTSAAVQTALDTLQGSADTCGRLGQYKSFKTGLKKLPSLLKRQTKIQAKLIDNQNKKAALATATRTSLSAQLSQIFSQNLYRDTLVNAAARAVTNSSGNYVSPDVGAALVINSYRSTQADQGGSKLSFMAYAGLNIYWVPVDRELAMDELVDSFWQRFSVTVGLSMTTFEDLDDVKFEGLVSDAYPVIGLGYRVMPFARFSVLGVLYRARSQSPISNSSEIYIAPSVALSLDADVMDTLQKALK